MIKFIALNIVVSPEKVDAFLSDVAKISNLKDYAYLFYPPNRIKLFLVDFEKDKVSDLVKIWCNQSVILGHEFIENNDDLYWDMILSCATMKIINYLKEKIDISNTDSLVNELVALPYVNALAYAPLHFICNQLKLNYEMEMELRLKLAINPEYIKGYRQINGNILR